MNNCPLCGSENVLLKEEIPTKEILEQYNKVMNIDVTSSLSEYEFIQSYRCSNCKYAFFLPADTAGDDLFYEQLEKFPWYYMEYKWEHRVAEKYIKDGDKVLEVGCARGDFLKRISQDKKVVAEGLELNSLAVKKANEQGLSVHLDTIENFSLQKKDRYDIVCSFQVLEHASNPSSMIRSSIGVLKKDGLLIVGIPNNDSFTSKDLNPLLNMPPHHMGQYHEATLEKMADIFKIKLEKIETEPLQKYHVSYYIYLYVGQHLKKMGLIGKILNKIVFIFAYPILRLLSKSIKGHTMTAVYRKI